MNQKWCPKCKKNETRDECKYGVEYWDNYALNKKMDESISNEPKLKPKSGLGGGKLSYPKGKEPKPTGAKLPKIKTESVLVDKILDEHLSSLNEKKGLWYNIDAKRKRGERPARPGEKGYPKTLDIDEDLKQARKNVGASKCWSGKVAKGTKIKGGREVPNCVPKESLTIQDANGNTFAEIVDLIKPEPIKGFKSQVSEATRMQSQTGNVIGITLSWRGKYYSLKMFFPQVKLPTRKEINDELQKVYPGSAVVYHSVSEIQPGQPLIQMCGPQGGSAAKPGSSKNYVKTMGEEVKISEDWQKVNRQDKTDGLSPAAVKAYRRENPGSKLQTAVTEKNPTGKRSERRKSFCRRMSGMKSKLTSATTARDPDSRINKALRRWNCR